MVDHPAAGSNLWRELAAVAEVAELFLEAA